LGQFLTILRVKAENAGLLSVAVNPNGTSPNCSNCGANVPKQLSDHPKQLSNRWHSCPHCHYETDRDVNTAVNIKTLAEEHPVNQACGERRDGGSKKQEALSIAASLVREYVTATPTLRERELDLRSFGAQLSC